MEDQISEIPYYKQYGVSSFFNPCQHKYLLRFADIIEKPVESELHYKPTTVASHVAYPIVVWNVMGSNHTKLF